MLGEIFDPTADVEIYEHCRPHWSQAGAVVFITFRTCDSIPQEVLNRWDREKQEWVKTRGLDDGRKWSDVLPTLGEKDQAAFTKYFERCREDFFDGCHGECLLKTPALAQIVNDSLLHFDGVRCRMGDFVVMPNHVHLLAVFSSSEALNEQCDSWTPYTAAKINRAIGSKGKFWQQEPFDHLVRSVEQYDYLRKYIADNPSEARLRPCEYLYRRVAD